MTPHGRILLIDTATRRALVALAGADGALVASDAWDSAHRHGEELLPRVDQLLSTTATPRSDLVGVAVGTGPGSFTGLRIGMAMAKTLCHSLRLPIVGVPTMEALACAVGDGQLAVVLPAGVGDRYAARYRVANGRASVLLPPTLTPAAQVEGLRQPDDRTVAVDLDEPEVSADAIALGRHAQAGLAQVMATMAASRLAAGESADLAALVPEYVALPRGVPAAAQESAWSPDLR